MALKLQFKYVFLDAAIVFAVGLIVLFLRLFGQPHERGFFCSDTTISYPRRDETVSDIVLAIATLIVPICLVTLGELLSCGLTSTSSVSWRDRPLPLFLVRSYTHAGHFAVGAGLAEVTVDMAKYYVGRLRPHFLDVCKPPISVCATSAREYAPGFPAYVTDFTCTGDPKDIKDARLSFPSGHAMLSFYAAVYLASYLQIRLRWPFSDVFRLVLQGGVVIVAWWITLSRINDNAHHPSDVIAGAIIGTVYAIVVTYTSNRLLKTPKCSTDENSTIRTSHQEKIHASTPCA